MAVYLQKYIAGMVSRQLQEYFDGVDQEAIGVALWNGELELQVSILRCPPRLPSRPRPPRRGRGGRIGASRPN